jgi:DNA-binding winged helix-turn-helix (wHTH) protein/predicted esterase
MRYAFADCLLDTASRTLNRGGTAVSVEPQVFDLLQLLAEHPDRVVTRDEIIDRVWGGRIVSESAISARIATARKAVGDDGKRQLVIRTVARRGLQIAIEVFTPETVQPPPFRESDALRIRFIRLPSGHAMAYATIGEGPPVIVVGHSRMDLEAEWQLPGERARHMALARRHKVVLFNPIGSGQSDRSADRAGIEMQAEDIGHLANALGLERFALSSFSGGCNPALFYAAHNPERVTRLAMVGAYAEGRLVRSRVGNNQAQEDPLRAMIAQGKTMQDLTFFTAAMLAYQPEGPLEDVTAFAKMVHEAASPEFELKIRDIINSHSSIDLLGRITCPVLILHSRHDAVHPLPEAHKLASGLSDAELVVLECRNHVPMRGNPAFDVYLQELCRFMAEPDSPNH